jgi:DNA polymerase III epsilon subunit-like protein
MNYNTFIVFDLETSGRNPLKCQPTQIAAIALHSKKLTIEPGGIFNSEIQPIFDDEKAIAAGFDPVEEKALEVTRKTREQLLQAPPPKVVWPKFAEWVKKFNYKNSSYTAPIPCGYNINGFDMPIVQRMCELYGPLNKDKKQDIFNNIFKIDMMDIVFMWTENNPDIKSRSLTSMVDYLGLSENNSESISNAHDALQDVKNTANILIKFLNFHRKLAAKTKFEKAFSGQELYIK